MELENFNYLKPKKQKGALNQAVQVLLQFESLKRRRDNTMKHKVIVSEKIGKLQEELERLEKTIDNLDRDSESYMARLVNLQTEFEITTLEIQEAKLNSFKNQIQRIEALKQAGLEVTNSTLI